MNHPVQFSCSEASLGGQIVKEWREAMDDTGGGVNRVMPSKTPKILGNMEPFRLVIHKPINSYQGKSILNAPVTGKPSKSEECLEIEDFLYTPPKPLCRSVLEMWTSSAPTLISEPSEIVVYPAAGGLTRPDQLWTLVPSIYVHRFPLSNVTAINSKDHGKLREIQFSLIFAET